MQPQVPCPTLAQCGWPWTPQDPFPAGNKNLFSHSKGRNRKQLNQAFWVFWPRAVGLVANFPSHAEPAPSPGPVTPRGKLSLTPRCPRRRRARVCVCAHTCVPSAAASGSAHPSRVPLSPHKPRLTGGWPHLSSTGLSHRTGLTALSEGHSQIQLTDPVQTQPPPAKELPKSPHAVMDET